MGGLAEDVHHELESSSQKNGTYDPNIGKKKVRFVFVILVTMSPVKLPFNWDSVKNVSLICWQFLRNGKVI